MPDITKCVSTDCPKAHFCLRFTCPWGTHQSAALFTPASLDPFNCEFFVDNTKTGGSRGSK